MKSTFEEPGPEGTNVEPPYLLGGSGFFDSVCPSVPESPASQMTLLASQKSIKQGRGY